VSGEGEGAVPVVPGAVEQLRPETRAQRADRNWTDLMQELRVLQTGTQILVGFLLTVPFQARFTELDAGHRRFYVGLVALAAVATVLIVAPVSMHRALFAKHKKPELVRAAAAFARAGLVCLALVLAGVVGLLVDVVIPGWGSWWAGGALLVLVAVTWWVVPAALARRAG